MCENYELLGVAEAAELTGAKKSTFVMRVASREGFPKPLARLRCGPIWSRAEVASWVEAHPREDKITAAGAAQEIDV